MKHVGLVLCALALADCALFTSPQVPKHWARAPGAAPADLRADLWACKVDVAKVVPVDYGPYGIAGRQPSKVRAATIECMAARGWAPAD